MSASTEKKNRQAAREAGTDKKMLAAQEEAKKNAQSKRRWTAGTVAVCLLIAVILLLNSGLVFKTTAYTVNGRDYNASEFSYHYASQYFYILNQYGSYASLFGLDPNSGIKGLDAQPCPMGDGSWKDYFVDAAKNEILQVELFLNYAKENGITLSEEDNANIEKSFEGVDEFAKLQGYASADKFYAANYGQGVNTAIIRKAYQDSTLASKALAALSDTFQYTPEELKAKYESYNGAQDLYDYVYYYVSAETVETTAADGTTTNAVNDETVAAAKAKADEIIAAYKASTGDNYTERLNAAVGSVVEGASAYEQTRVQGSNLGDYRDWVTDSARRAGDVTSVISSAGSGYYVVVFVGHDDNNYNLVSVRHILVKAEADENGEYTAEAKAAAKAKAEQLLAEFNAGDKSEESFAMLAVNNTEDEGSRATGGLYTDIVKGQMVKEFNDFCFGGHKPGDTGIVYGESASYAGYHVMYFVGEGQNYRDYIAENDLRASAVNAWIEEKTAAAVTSEGFGMKFIGK